MLTFFKLIFTSFTTLIFMNYYLEYAEIETPSYIDFDPEIGRIMIPNAEWSRYIEGLSLAKVNEFGYLGPAYPKNKNNKNVFRIGLVGDSFVQGIQVHSPYNIRDIIEAGLDNIIKDREIEVLNFGRSRFKLQDVYCYIENFVSFYECDLYVIFICNSDFTDIYDDPLLPKCSISNDSIIILKNFSESYMNFYKRILHPMNTYSVLKLIKNVYALRDELPKIILGKFYKFGKDDSKALIDNIYKSIPPINFDIVDHLENKYNVLWVWREEELPLPGIADRIRNVKNFYSFSEVFNDLYSKGINPREWKASNVDRGHWNFVGHQIVAEKLIEEITQGNYCNP